MNHPRNFDAENAGEAHLTSLSLLDRATRRLEAAGCAPPRRTAEWMLAEVLEASRAWLYAHADRLVNPDAARRFEAMVERRVQGEPLQHVLGHTSFYGLRIQVSPDVMVPRPETETVVERALDSLGDVDAPCLLDVGTGTGLALHSLARANPDGWTDGVDLTPAMLRRAHQRLKRMSHGRYRLHQARATALPFANSTFDAVFSSYLIDVLPDDQVVPALREMRRVLRPHGRLVLVYLAPPRRPVERLWTTLARWLPLLLGGARPIALKAPLRASGFHPQAHTSRVQFGLRSAIIRATPTLE